jgi:uncharacterized membrane protein HdeD (DUF308 family)
MLLHLVVTMKTLTVIFGLWMLITGLLLVQSGWSLRSKNSFGWIMVIAGVLSVVAAVMIVFNIGTGAVGISTLLGLQVLLTGIQENHKKIEINGEEGLQHMIQPWRKSEVSN